MAKKGNTSPMVDIKEDDLRELSCKVLETLLIDHTTHENIFWATHDYENLGPEYSYHSPILPELITGKNGMVIQPRVLKTQAKQMERVKGMAEVFTPSWVCNAQNNLVDEAWFGRKNVFNIEDENAHIWETTTEPIIFPEGKTWKDYVRATRMEITCGEAPYLVSRYDTTTGEFIPLENRIGLLDRKLRVINENVHERSKWLKWAQVAFKNTYGYEWQGDNLLLAREALLWTFIENYIAKFKVHPLTKSIKAIAYIVSWNLWQMDGLKCVVPDSCHVTTVCTNQIEIDEAKNDPISLMFPDEAVPVPEPKLEEQECPGCVKGDIFRHNGIPCLIRDWGIKDREKQKIEFRSLINNTNESNEN